MRKLPMSFPAFRIAAAGVALAAGVFGPSDALAQAVEGAPLLGMGGARRAFARSNDAIYVNPAGMALNKLYSLEGTFLDDFRDSDRRFNASVVDSQAGPVAAGVAYTYLDRRPDDWGFDTERLKGHRVEVAAASRLAQGAAFGLSLRYLNMRRTNEDQRLGHFAVFNVDAGLQWQVAKYLALGLAGYNLVPSDRSELDTRVGGGVGLQLTDFLQLEIDVQYGIDDRDVEVSSGADVLVADLVSLRGAATWLENTDEWRLSVGAGIADRQVGLHVGYRRTLNPAGIGRDRDNQIFALSLTAKLL